MNVKRMNTGVIVDSGTTRARERGDAVEALAQAKQREAELTAAGKLITITVGDTTFRACGRYVEQIKSLL